jgi:hypothetical protein
VARIDVVTIVLLLAGLPWLARWFPGPPSGSRLGRFLRAGAYAAVLALMVAKASVLQAVPAETAPALQFVALAWILLLGFIGSVAAIDWPGLSSSGGGPPGPPGPEPVPDPPVMLA